MATVCRSGLSDLESAARVGSLKRRARILLPGDVRDALRAAPARTPIRCAIYTRQSVEPHTDLSSCQVQFDLCSAYVQSQRSRGYVVVEERFDDEGLLWHNPRKARLTPYVERRPVWWHRATRDPSP